ncbi:hypothetical protein ACU6ZM_23835 [Klebsiella aerogenes]
MTTNTYKIRVANNLTKKNDVICFDYIQELSSEYAAISYERYFGNREEGYFYIIKKILSVINCEEDQTIYYYNEFPFLINDTKVNRYKGYWGLKPYKTSKYDFLSCKSQVLSSSGTQLQMKGLAKLNMDELKMLINQISYQERSFFFYFPKVKLGMDYLSSTVEMFTYSQVMNYMLNDDGVIFILLGDEDFKTSEVAVIAKRKIINVLMRVDLPI